MTECLRSNESPWEEQVQYASGPRVLTEWLSCSADLDLFRMIDMRKDHAASLEVSHVFLCGLSIYFAREYERECRLHVCIYYSKRDSTFSCIVNESFKTTEPENYQSCTTWFYSINREPIMARHDSSHTSTPPLQHKPAVHLDCFLLSISTSNKAFCVEHSSIPPTTAILSGL